MNGLHEECGVFGIINMGVAGPEIPASAGMTQVKHPEIAASQASRNDALEKGGLNVAEATMLGLTMLQHRGQESAGIATSDGGEVIKFHKGMGLVSKVFSEEKLNYLTGKIGIGHVRYSTTGESSKANMQPFIAQTKFGELAIAHNGNIVNTNQLKGMYQDCVFKGTSDTEVLAVMLASEIDRLATVPVSGETTPPQAVPPFVTEGELPENDALGTDPAINAGKLTDEQVYQVINEVFQHVLGAYSIVILFQDKLIALRDPLGMRPLSAGKIGNTYVFASETVAIRAIDARHIGYADPGQIVIVDEQGLRSQNLEIKNSKFKGQEKFCVFEYIYFARPDSVINDISVYSFRLQIGKMLAEEHKIDADVVFGVPDSGLPSALGYSRASGVNYADGFIRSRYSGRSFIEPSQFMREKAVSLKHSPLENEIKGKKIIVIDDSIVRGTTLKKLVVQLKKAGAKEINVLIASPAIKHPCFFGVDMPNTEDLIAANMSVEEIKEHLGVDYLGYLSLDGLVKAEENAFAYDNDGVSQVKKKAPKKDWLCAACFDGTYPY
jgi:amidophosphoribosyltransferase